MLITKLFRLSRDSAVQSALSPFGGGSAYYPALALLAQSCFSSQTKISRLGATIKEVSQPADPLSGTESVAGSAKSLLNSSQEAFNAIPKLPKLLGFAGEKFELAEQLI
jgi:hypothetical protein